MEDKQLGSVAESASTINDNAPWTWPNQCKSMMWQCVLGISNVKTNGSKYDKFNDFKQFEEQFEEWDHDAILLTVWDDDRFDQRHIQTITPLGVFTDISTLGRRLQEIVYRHHDAEVNAMMFGHELHLSVSDSKRRYVMSFVDLNQKNSGTKHYDGWVIDLITPTVQEKNDT